MRDVRQLRPLPIGATSDDVDEGSTNLYFTNERLAQACADGSVLDVVRCESVQVLSDLGITALEKVKLLKHKGRRKWREVLRDNISASRGAGVGLEIFR